MTAKKDTPKRKAPDPIPLVGVRGSSTMISAPKTIAVAGAGIVALTPRPGHNDSPLDVARGKGSFNGNTGVGAGLQLAVENVVTALKDSPVARAGAAVLGVGLLFGKAIDRRFPAFPVRFGK